MCLGLYVWKRLLERGDVAHDEIAPAIPEGRTADMADIDVAGTDVTKAGLRRAQAVIDLFQISIDKVDVIQQADGPPASVLDVKTEPNTIWQINDLAVVDALSRGIDASIPLMSGQGDGLKGIGKLVNSPYVGERGYSPMSSAE